MKKRILSLILAICMVLSLCPTVAYAEIFEEFEYSVFEDEVTITCYTGSATDVEIPDTIDGKPVKAIGDSAFKDKAITSVAIPNGVTSIGIRAFQNCKSLTSIVIPSGVTIIEQGTFEYCDNLSSVTIPDGVTAIGNSSFHLCKNLESINIPDSVTSIGNSAFQQCQKLTSINIPDGVSSIGYGVFIECTSLESVEIPNSVTSINDYVFGGCTSLESIDIPNSVTYIGSYAFDKCTSLESIDIPNSVTFIGKGAFRNCTTLESIFLPKDLDVTNARIPDTVSQVRYNLDETAGEVTITKITLGTDKTSVAIPTEICGYPVVAVADSEQSKVGSHTCVGGTATCTAKAECSICGKEYNIPDNHSGKLVWKTTETQHKKYWNCCNAVVVNYEDHTWNNGVCSECDYICSHNDSSPKDHHCDICAVTLSEHTGGTATCTNKAICEYCNAEYGELDNTNHNLEKVFAKESSVVEIGNIEYWHCTDCGKFFEDENGKNEININDTIILKLPPEMIDGEGQSLTEGEIKELSFRSNASFSDFIRVELDGVTVDAENYTATEGSTIITLKADYVATLSAGEHTIGIVSESGTAEASFTINKKSVDDPTEPSQAEDDTTEPTEENENMTSPETGNDENAFYLAILVAMCVSGVTTVSICRKRRKRFIK